jgi:hypothetical protein
MTIAPDRARTAEELVTVTIDGIEISVPKGTLLIRAAEQLGIQIPRFCDHPHAEARCVLYHHCHARHGRQNSTDVSGR